jgi:hypothetical protein
MPRRARLGRKPVLFDEDAVPEGFEDQEQEGGGGGNAAHNEGAGPWRRAGYLCDVFVFL